MAACSKRPRALDGTPEYSSAKIDHLRGALYKTLDAVTRGDGILGHHMEDKDPLRYPE
jgi:hypothetical protein